MHEIFTRVVVAWKQALGSSGRKKGWVRGRETRARPFFLTPAKQFRVILVEGNWHPIGNTFGRPWNNIVHSLFLFTQTFLVIF